MAHAHRDERLPRRPRRREAPRAPDARTLAFGQYRRAPSGDGHTAWGLVVLEIDGDRIRRWNTFLVANLFPRFGLPLELR